MIVERPKKIKFGRVFRKKKESYKNSNVHNFLYNYKLGLKVLEDSNIRYFHVKTIILVLKKIFKKSVRIELNVAFTQPITRKAEQSRMGKGKGKREYWEGYVFKGMILVEIGGFKSIPKLELANSLFSVKYRLPFKCKLVKLVY